MKRREILLIDDDPIINLINSRVIKSHFPDMHVTAVKSGQEGLEYICDNQTKAYLIFLDIHMPQMNGWEFIAKIRECEFSLDLQIHILTSSVDNIDIRKAKENDQVLSYLLKPLKIDVLKSLAY